MTRAAPRRFTAGGLKTACSALRADLLTAGLASEEECRAYWPGGRENLDRGFDGFVYCYQQYGRLMGRGEPQHGADSKQDALLEATVRAAAARQPMPVQLSIGERLVYPKSAWALAWLDALDSIIAPAATMAAELASSEDTAIDHLRAFPVLLQAMAVRTWVWVLLSEGVGVPFGDEGVIDPPEYTTKLLPEDLIAIYSAHQKLHYDAITVMAAAMPKEDGEESRLSLGGFLAGYASEHGVAPSHIMRRWSFPEAIAAAIATYESHRVSQLNAKRKREGNG